MKSTKIFQAATFLSHSVDYSYHKLPLTFWHSWLMAGRKKCMPHIERFYENIPWVFLFLFKLPIFYSQPQFRQYSLSKPYQYLLYNKTVYNNIFSCQYDKIPCPSWATCQPLPILQNIYPWERTPIGQYSSYKCGTTSIFPLISAVLESVLAWRNIIVECLLYDGYWYVLPHNLWTKTRSVIVLWSALCQIASLISPELLLLLLLLLLSFV